MKRAGITAMLDWNGELSQRSESLDCGEARCCSRRAAALPPLFESGGEPARMTCHLCLEHVPFERIADHMRLLHPDLVWHGDDPHDARADAWPDGKTVVHEDAETLADVT